MKGTQTLMENQEKVAFTSAYFPWFLHHFEPHLEWILNDLSFYVSICLSISYLYICIFIYLLLLPHHISLDFFLNLLTQNWRSFINLWIYVSKSIYIYLYIYLSNFFTSAYFTWSLLAPLLSALVRVRAVDAGTVVLHHHSHTR